MIIKIGNKIMIPINEASMSNKRLSKMVSIYANIRIVLKSFWVLPSYLRVSFALQSYLEFTQKVYLAFTFFLLGKKETKTQGRTPYFDFTPAKAIALIAVK